MGKQNRTEGGKSTERERAREREGERERERENERTNAFCFINEGNGINTILFYIQPSGKIKKIENKTIINSNNRIS